MVLGSIYAPKSKVAKISARVKEIKAKHGLGSGFEIKWTKISPSKIQLYKDVIDYFFDDDDLHFRAIIIDKQELSHSEDHTHDEFYYKSYFLLLNRILNPEDSYNIYLDIKDTRGSEKVSELHKILATNLYDFQRSIVRKVQQVRSHEIELLQIVDLLIGALQFANREDVTSTAKKEVLDRIKKRSTYGLLKSTLLGERKFNLFYWHRKKLSDYDDTC